MTEYKETEQDRKDAETLAAIDGWLAVLATVERQAKDNGLYQTARGTEQDRESLENRRARIVHDSEARLAAFYSDREKLKRAFAALRKEGFTTSMVGPSWESTAPTPANIAKAQEEGSPWALIRRDHLGHAFQPEGYRFDRKQGDTLTRELSITWGPADDSSTDLKHAEAIIAALEAEGLATEWEGTVYRVVTVLPAAKEEVISDDRANV